jgi:hypothetical protein
VVGNELPSIGGNTMMWLYAVSFRSMTSDEQNKWRGQPMRIFQLSAILLVVGLSVATAAPLVPSSELPGRQRERFTPSPLDRFMQPSQPTGPLLRWDCDDRGPPPSKQQRSRRNRDC